MNSTTTDNISPVEQKRPRGRPKGRPIHEDQRACWRSSKRTWREKNPEKYLANAFRKRDPVFCDVCNKFYSQPGYKPHLEKRNHLAALFKKSEITSEINS